ncbi:trichohyalin-like [Plectropomus leopardus]|uniref:trichohyalin-like n=1 Tax=Plectropomus leopardus TaxID=160734 RepID=UPI001C4D7FD9|nr:trichohyalin-like [Plectropomus leopardus]
MSLSDQQQWCPTSVQVTVLQARGLRTKGKSGTNDAYAVMQVGKEKYQTSVMEKSVAPVWKEEAAFDLPTLHGGGGGGTERSTLHVHVLHRALVGPDKLLGQAVINLLQLSEDKTRDKTQWFKLLDKTGKADKDRGEVLVDIQFMRHNMTASMFDLSAAGKSRSRLGKFKDKVRGKKKESDASSNVVPSFTQVLTDSEEEGNGDAEVAADKDEKKKKHKMKSLFSPKSNLQKNMSQSMSVLPAKNSSLSGSQSSGLNVDSSEGKKKFKFKIHKRSGSSGSKDPASGHQKQGAAEQSNLCINGSHVYCEEPPPRTSRIGSNYSLTSSGRGSMEDVPDSSPPSVDSLRGARQCSPWTEEEEEVENIKEDVGELREEEEERIKMEEEERRRREEEESARRQEEELERVVEEKRRQEEQERRRIEEENLKKEEEERIRREERRRQEEEEQLRRDEEERERLAEEKRKLEEEERRIIEEEKRKREEEERAQEERRKQEEEERVRREEKRRQQEEERVMREEEEERERLAEEKRRLEEQERRRIEEERVQEEKRRQEEEERVRREEEEERERLAEEKWRLEEQERRRIEEERVQEEKRRQEEEECERLAEEKRRLQEQERRIEEERIRKEEEERAEDEKRRREEEEREAKRRLEEQERRRREEEEMLRMEEERAQEERRRQEEEEIKLAKEKRRLEEEERRIKEEKIRKEEEERIRKEEERMRLEKEMMRRLEEEREEKRRLEEQERRQREEEERIKKEEEAKKEKEEFERLLEEKRKLEEEERKRIEAEEKMRREEEERIRVEEERRKKEEEEESAKRQEEERERLAQEKRKLEEQERRIEEEEKRQKEEEERIRKEEERRQEEEERVRKEKEEEKARQEEQERKRIEEEERIRREENAEKERREEEARKLEKEKLARDAEEHKKRENTTKAKAPGRKLKAETPAEVTSTNPFDESPDSSTARESAVKQRIQLGASLERSKPISTDEKNPISAQRERRPAPQPPGSNQAERQSQREQDASTRHLAQTNKQSKDKDIRTVSVLPQRLVQMIAPLGKSPTDAKNTQSLTQSSTKPSKRPAPSRPCSVEDEPSSEHKTALSPSDGNISAKSISEAKQAPIVYSLNPFEDDEDEAEAQDDTTTSGNTGSAQWPPAGSQAADKDAASQAKVKSSKTRAPPVPAMKAAKSSTSINQSTDGDHVTDDTGVSVPVKSSPDPETEKPVSVQEAPLQESQPVKVQRAGEEAGGKKEGQPVASRRLQPVKPLNPLEQQPVSVVQGEKENKSTKIICEVQEKTKSQVNDGGLKGPFSQLTQEELISLVLKQETQLSERDKKIAELEQYIDNLIVRIIDEKPEILMSVNSLKKAA